MAPHGLKERQQLPCALLLLAIMALFPGLFSLSLKLSTGLQYEEVSALRGEKTDLLGLYLISLWANLLPQL